MITSDSSSAHSSHTPCCELSRIDAELCRGCYGKCKGQQTNHILCGCDAGDTRAWHGRPVRGNHPLGLVWRVVSIPFENCKSTIANSKTGIDMPTAASRSVSFSPPSARSSSANTHPLRNQTPSTATSTSSSPLHGVASSSPSRNLVTQDATLPSKSNSAIPLAQYVRPQRLYRAIWRRRMDPP